MRNSPEQYHDQEVETEPKANFEVVTVEHEDRNRLTYHEYVFRFGSSQFSVYFKNQENLFDPDLLEHKTAIMVGDTPHAREPASVKENWDHLERSTDGLFYVNLAAKNVPNFPFEATLGFEQKGGERRLKYQIDSSQADYPKPQTGLRNNEMQKFKSVATGEHAVFVVDSQARSLADMVIMIKSIFPEANFGSKGIDLNNIAKIEDLIIAGSFDSQGNLAIDDKGNPIADPQEIRSKILMAMLGDSKAFDEVKGKYEATQKFFPSYLIYNLLLERESIYNNLRSERQQMDERSSDPFAVKNSKERIDELEKRLSDFNEFLELYEQGQEIEIPETLIIALDRHVAIHMTQYEPLVDQETGQLIIPTNSGARGNKNGRITSHFSIDGTATAVAMGDNDWSSYRVGILAPLGQLVKENGLMANFMPADTYWVVDHNQPGIRIPKNSTILVRDINKSGLGKLQKDQSLSEENIEVKDFGPDTIKDTLLYKYKVGMRELGTDTWLDNRGFDDGTYEQVKKVYPAITGGRHFATLSYNFENNLNGYFERVLVSDHQTEIAEAISQTGSTYYKNLIEQSPEEVVLNARMIPLSQINKKLNKYDVHAGMPHPIPKEYARMLVAAGVI